MVPGGIRELLFGPLRRVGVMQEQPGGSISSNLPSHRNCCCCSCPHSGGSSSYDGAREQQPRPPMLMSQAYPPQQPYPSQLFTSVSPAGG